MGVKITPELQEQVRQELAGYLEVRRRHGRLGKELRRKALGKIRLLPTKEGIRWKHALEVGSARPSAIAERTRAINTRLIEHAQRNTKPIITLDGQVAKEETLSSGERVAIAVRTPDKRTPESNLRPIDNPYSLQYTPPEKRKSYLIPEKEKVRVTRHRGKIVGITDPVAKVSIGASKDEYFDPQEIRAEQIRRQESKLVDLKPKPTPEIKEEKKRNIIRIPLSTHLESGETTFLKVNIDRAKELYEKANIKISQIFKDVKIKPVEDTELYPKKQSTFLDAPIFKGFTRLQEATKRGESYAIERRKEFAYGVEGAIQYTRDRPLDVAAIGAVGFATGAVFSAAGSVATGAAIKVSPAIMQTITSAVSTGGIVMSLRQIREEGKALPIDERGRLYGKRVVQFAAFEVGRVSYKGYEAARDYAITKLRVSKTKGLPIERVSKELKLNERDVDVKVRAAKFKEYLQILSTKSTAGKFRTVGYGRPVLVDEGLIDVRKIPKGRTYKVVIDEDIFGYNYRPSVLSKKGLIVNQRGLAKYKVPNYKMKRTGLVTQEQLEDLIDFGVTEIQATGITDRSVNILRVSRARAEMVDFGYTVERQGGMLIYRPLELGFEPGQIGFQEKIGYTPRLTFDRALLELESEVVTSPLVSLGEAEIKPRFSFKIIDVPTVSPGTFREIGGGGGTISGQAMKTIQVEKLDQQPKIIDFNITKPISKTRTQQVQVQIQKPVEKVKVINIDTRSSLYSTSFKKYAAQTVDKSFKDYQSAQKTGIDELSVDILGKDKQAQQEKLTPQQRERFNTIPDTIPVTKPTRPIAEVFKPIIGETTRFDIIPRTDDINIIKPIIPVPQRPKPPIPPDTPDPIKDIIKVNFDFDYKPRQDKAPRKKSKSPKLKAKELKLPSVEAIAFNITAPRGSIDPRIYRTGLQLRPIRV